MSEPISAESSILMISLQEALRQLDQCMNSPLAPSPSKSEHSSRSASLANVASPADQSRVSSHSDVDGKMSNSIEATTSHGGQPLTPPSLDPACSPVVPDSESPDSAQSRECGAREEMSAEQLMREYKRVAKAGGRASSPPANQEMEQGIPAVKQPNQVHEMPPPAQPPVQEPVEESSLISERAQGSGVEDHAHEDSEVQLVRAKLDGMLSDETRESLKAVLALQQEHDGGHRGAASKPVLEPEHGTELAEEAQPTRVESPQGAPAKRDRRKRHQEAAAQDESEDGEQQHSQARSPSRRPTPSELLARYHGRNGKNSPSPEPASLSPPVAVPKFDKCYDFLPHLKYAELRRRHHSNLEGSVDRSTPEAEAGQSWDPAEDPFRAELEGRVMSPEDKAEIRAERARKRREYKNKLRQEEAEREAQESAEQGGAVQEALAESLEAPAMAVEADPGSEIRFVAPRQTVAGPEVRQVLEQVGAPTCRLDHVHVAGCAGYSAPMLPVNIGPRAAAVPQQGLDSASVSQLKVQLKANLAAHQQALEAQYGQLLQRLDEMEPESDNPNQTAAGTKLRQYASETSEAGALNTRDVIRSSLTQWGATPSPQPHSSRKTLQYHSVISESEHTRPAPNNPTPPSQQQPPEPTAPIMVRMLYNDGATRRNPDMVTALVTTIEQVLNHATNQLAELPAAAARVFTTSGHELLTLSGAQDGLPVVISCGEPFRPRLQSGSTPRRPSPSPSSRARSPSRTYCPYVHKMSSRSPPVIPTQQEPPQGLRKRPKVTLVRNDGGASTKKKVVLVYTLRTLLDESAQALELNRAARQIFTGDGEQVSSISQLTDGMLLVIGTGEKFKKRK